MTRELGQLFARRNAKQLKVQSVPMRNSIGIFYLKQHTMEDKINPNLGAFVSFLIFSDNVVRTGKDEYRTQCSQYTIRFTLSELYKYFVKEYSFN